MFEVGKIYSLQEMKEELVEYLHNLETYVTKKDIKSVDKGPFIKIDSPPNRRIIGTKFDKQKQKDAPNVVIIDREMGIDGDNFTYAKELYNQKNAVPTFIKEKGMRGEWKYVGLHKLVTISDPTGDEDYPLKEGKEIAGILHFEKQIDDNQSENIIDILVSNKGAAFGHPSNNKDVEEVAINLVTGKLENDGWKVTSRENEKVGYDLECNKGNQIMHVEVKGCSGLNQSFFITRNELKKAKIDSDFYLYTVTSALQNPQCHIYKGKDVESTFKPEPILYKAEYQRTKPKVKRPKSS